MNAKPYSDEELKRFDLRYGPEHIIARFKATITELKEGNHRLFKDVLTLKKNLGEYAELCVSDVEQKKRIKTLEAHINAIKGESDGQPRLLP